MPRPQSFDAATMTWYLRYLRDRFLRLADEFRHLHHVLLCHNDDVNDAMQGDRGILKSGEAGPTHISTPNFRGQVIAFDLSHVLVPPVWRDDMPFSVPPRVNLANASSEFRAKCVAKPGVLASSLIVTTELTQEACEYCRLLTAMSDDAATVSKWLSRQAGFKILETPPDDFSRGGPFGWYYAVHRLGWLAGRKTLNVATKTTWSNGRRSFFPADSESIRMMKQHMGGFMGGAINDISDPPDRYISTLKQDAFTAFGFAASDMLNAFENGQSLDEYAMEASPSSEQRPSVFVSYSHEDRDWLDKFTGMLDPMVRGGTISVWHDKQLKPSDAWRAEIEAALQNASIGLLLVSRHFLSSNFIQENELPYLLESAEKRGVKLVWALIEDCMYEDSPLSSVQAAHDVSTPISALRGNNQAKTIKAICQSLKPQRMD